MIVMADLREKAGYVAKSGPRRESERGSVLVMVTVLSFVMFLMGLTYLSAVERFGQYVSIQVSRSQSYYAAFAGLADGEAMVRSGDVSFDYTGDWDDWYGFIKYRTLIEPSGGEEFGYGFANGYNISGEGVSTFNGWDGEFRSTLHRSYEVSTFADYLYLTDKERDPRRLGIVFFWSPDTLDGKVHSNDTLHFSGTPRFMKRVTSSAPVTDPPYPDAQFDEGIYLNAARIFFPDQADEIRNFNGYPGWGTHNPDSATEITFSGPYIYRRYCGYDEDGVFQCIPDNIASAFMIVLPATGALFIDGKVIVKADRGRPDIMDPAFISSGYSGRMTLASSDTMIIPDNLVYMSANPDNSVPTTSRDVLGLISENYIMFGEDVADTIYIDAAMAAIKGSITVQDIYEYGQTNEKQSLFIYGCLAQRNRGLVHSSFGGGLRGFIEKDYHYDTRLAKSPPPHYLPTRQNPRIYSEGFYDEG